MFKYLRKLSHGTRPAGKSLTEWDPAHKHYYVTAATGCLTGAMSGCVFSSASVWRTK